MTTPLIDRITDAHTAASHSARPEAWIHLAPLDTLIDRACELDARAHAGDDLPLLGLTVAVKDNIDVAGMPTTAACPGLCYTPTTSATAVQLLERAGAIVLGKTNMDQFATGLVGARSPYGAVRSTLDPSRVSGGSSSGSAVAVALGEVDFALGTDTAGSGRIPAAFNGIYGVKPTLGLVSTRGMLPACRPYDTVSVFARELSTAARVLRVITDFDPEDPLSRPVPAHSPLAVRDPSHLRLAIPAEESLTSLDTAVLAGYRATIHHLTRAGHTIVPVDISPLLDCAKLLYEGGLLAERYAAFGELLDAHRTDADPIVARIVDASRTVPAVSTVRDQHRVREVRRCWEQMKHTFDALIVPTAPCHPTFDELAQDPIGVNARIGTFTNFVNLLDLCAVATPTRGARCEGHVTVIADRHEDQIALDIADVVSGSKILGQDDARAVRSDSAFQGVGGEASALVVPRVFDGLPIVVFGAHMRGMALNSQLTELGARFDRVVHTAPHYRMGFVPASPGGVAKPAVSLIDGAGASLEGEQWHLPPARLADFAAMIPAPLALGQITLSEGTSVLGFCAQGVIGPDISAYGSWRAFLEGEKSGA